MTVSEYSDFHIPPYNIRNTHMYIGGASRFGKTTMLERIISRDINNMKGVTVLDPKPQGLLAKSILQRVPEARKDHAIYLDIADPVPIDVMSWETPSERHLLHGNLMDMFESFAPSAPESQWPNLIRACLHTLLEAHRSSFLEIEQVILDEEFRNGLLEKGDNPYLKKYWDMEFPTIRQDTKASALGRMKQFTFSPLGKLVNCWNPKLKISDIIRNEQIFIVNLGTLSKGDGDLVGRLLVTKIMQAAFAQDPENPTPHYLFADEFQNFQTSAFDTILSEAGGFQLCLCLANQGLYQLTDNVLNAIFTNVNAARIAFHLNHKDVSNWAHLLPTTDRQSRDYIDPQRLAKLPQHKAFYSVYGTRPKIKTTLPPLPKLIPNFAQYIQNRTRDLYTCPNEPNPLYSKKDGNQPPASPESAELPDTRTLLPDSPEEQRPRTRRPPRTADDQ